MSDQHPPTVYDSDNPDVNQAMAELFPTDNPRQLRPERVRPILEQLMRASKARGVNELYTLEAAAEALGMTRQGVNRYILRHPGLGTRIHGTRAIYLTPEEIAIIRFRPRPGQPAKDSTPIERRRD